MQSLHSYTPTRSFLSWAARTHPIPCCCNNAKLALVHTHEKLSLVGCSHTPNSMLLQQCKTCTRTHPREAFSRGLLAHTQFHAAATMQNLHSYTPTRSFLSWAARTHPIPCCCNNAK